MIFSILAVAFVPVTHVAAATPDATATTAQTAAPGPQPGDVAPAFALTSLAGKPVTLDAYRGKTLVINVWATWCPPCREEMPDLIAAAPAYAKDGSVAFLGVDSTEQAPIVRAYAAAKGVPYALAIDADRSFAKAYDIEGFPTTYVIDPAGIVRAKYVDTLGPRELADLIAAAKAGRNASIVSPLQAKIDATLADPTIAFTSSDPATLETMAITASSAIDRAESLLDDSDSANGKATDYTRTRTEEAALRDRAIAALVSAGTVVKDPKLLPLLRGEAASDRQQWSDALAAYRAVLAIDSKNEDALGGVSLAATRLEKYDDAIDADRQLVALEPKDVGALVDLALTQAKAGEATDAYATFATAVVRAKDAVDASPGKASAVRRLAYVHLYAGRTYAKNGDAARARDEFDRMLAWTQKLPANDERHDMYLEEGQEAIAALGLGSATGLSVSLAPWTGADLPGSIPNTIKYRLVLAGRAGKNVTLRASGLPKTWVASFCSDKVCAPMRVALAIPSSGVKIVEFQLIPPGAKQSAPRVRVTGSDGTTEAAAST
jgi:peroxiredoxin